jgi:hypothetical protein
VNRTPETRNIVNKSGVDNIKRLVPVVDTASQCLTTTLTNQTKTICVTHGSALEAFYPLFGWFSQGAGTSGSLYSPERAYLTGFQLADSAAPLPEPDVAWPESLADVPVAEAVTGLWLEEGEALRVLWEATNRNPYHMPVVGNGDERYRIILQLPGLSWIEP